MEQLKGGILITPKEIQALTGYSLNAAQKEHKAVRDALGKKKSRFEFFFSFQILLLVSKRQQYRPYYYHNTSSQ